MLSAKEFTVGSIGQAKPPTLVLPRHSTDQMFLIGTSSSNEPMAYVLTGRAQFLCFASTGNDHWHGLLVPNVRIEVDETSIFDPKQESVKLGSVVRESTFLTVKGTPNNSGVFGRIESMILEDNLMQAGGESAGFTRWDIVLGEGRNKRLLHHVDLSTV